MVMIGHPFTAAAVKELRLGDMVSLSGRVYTARDNVCRYLYDHAKAPADLRDGALYHCGPIVDGKDNLWKVASAGPTTSMRVEKYTPRIIEQHHVRVLIGKGGMGQSTRKACAKHACVYLQAVGGAASVLAESIINVAGVHFLTEFGSAEAMWTFEMSNFVGVVSIDTAGRSLHDRVRRSSKRELRKLIADGDA
ncbi:MAG: FumA C-terminus/TtdB family hydratase beta subunit [Kiritimatiellia bacterium]